MLSLLDSHSPRYRADTLVNGGLSKQEMLLLQNQRVSVEGMTMNSMSRGAQSAGSSSAPLADAFVYNNQHNAQQQVMMRQSNANMVRVSLQPLCKS